MIKSLRWRLTLSFVLLSSLVCVVLALIGLVFMHIELTRSLDRQTNVLTSEFGHAIDVKDGKPFFRDWKRVVQTNPPRGIATIQLFSNDGKLLESYGPKGIDRLVSSVEVADRNNSYRVRSTALIRDGKNIGYLQVMVATVHRDEALYNFALATAGLSPLMLLGLGLTSFWVSGKAVEPLEANVANMRTFLADAGHELNTPLSIITARAESLQRKLERKSIDTGDVSVINKSAQRTIRLANDLMLLSELEGSLSNRPQSEVEIDGLISQIAQDFSDRLQDKGIILEVGSIPPANVMGNADELYRGFANLVENAYRYTNPGGLVRISAGFSENLIQVNIVDTGVGISPTHLPHIFERFYRVDKSRSRASGGSGLGLAIVKAVIERHGGTVAVDSSEDDGSTFTVILHARARNMKACVQKACKSR